MKRGHTGTSLGGKTLASRSYKRRQRERMRAQERLWAKQSGEVVVLSGDAAAARLAELRGELVDEKERATGTR